MLVTHFASAYRTHGAAFFLWRCPLHHQLFAQENFLLFIVFNFEKKTAPAGQRVVFVHLVSSWSVFFFKNEGGFTKTRMLLWGSLMLPTCAFFELRAHHNAHLLLRNSLGINGISTLRLETCSSHKLRSDSSFNRLWQVKTRWSQF